MLLLEWKLAGGQSGTGLLDHKGDKGRVFAVTAGTVVLADLNVTVAVLTKQHLQLLNPLTDSTLYFPRGDRALRLQPVEETIVSGSSSSNTRKRAKESEQAEVPSKKLKA